MDRLNQSVDELLFDAPQHLSADEWREKRESIEAFITVLIERDFARLVELLYRVDISEIKLKSLLAQMPVTNSAILITDLIMERQLQKIAFRNQQKPDTDIPEEERW